MQVPRPSVASLGASSPTNERLLLPLASPETTIDQMKDEAMAVAQRLVDEFPDSPHSHHVLARVHAFFGNSAEAVKCWRQCLTLDPGFVAAYQEIGLSLMDEGKHREAADLLRQALAIDRSQRDLAGQLATALIYSGNLEEARALLEEEIYHGTASEATHFLLGEVFLQLRQFDEAQQHLQTVLKMAPQHTHAYYGLARAYDGLGDHQRAAECRRKFQTLKGRNQQDQRDELHRRSDRSIVRRSLAATYFEAGTVYHDQGRTASAESCWLHAAALDPDDAESRMALGRLYRQRNDRGKLLEILRQLRAHGLSNPNHCLEAGRLAQEQGCFEFAEEAFTRLSNLVPDRAEGYRELASLYVHTNRKAQQAVELARQAVQLQPTAENYLLLGAACQARGDRAAAIVAVGRAVQREPDNPTYREAYETLQESR